jgi:hypothetical protein
VIKRGFFVPAVVAGVRYGLGQQAQSTVFGEAAWDRIADSRWQMADGRWKMADGRWKMEALQGEGGVLDSLSLAARLFNWRRSWDMLRRAG